MAHTKDTPWMPVCSVKFYKRTYKRCVKMSHSGEEDQEIYLQKTSNECISK